MAREFSVLVSIDASRARRGAREFKVGADQVRRSSGQMERGLRGANRRAVAMITTLGRLRGVATVVFSGFLGVGGISAVIRTLSQFETEMSRVTALVSAQGPRSLGGAMGNLTDKARELGATTIFTATQAAEGMRFLTMAGFEALEVYQAIEPALNLAAAGMLDLGNAADIVSNIMAAFSIDASETSDVVDALAFTAARSNTSIQQLGEAMKFVGPVAGTLGVNVEDTAVALGILGNSGLQASLAGTSLRRVMSGLLNPSKESEAVFLRLGLTQEELVATMQGENGLVNLVYMLANAGIDAADAFTLFGQRGAPGLLSLVNQRDKLAQLTEEQRKAGEVAKEMAKIMADNIGGDARIALSALQEAILRLGESGLSDWLRSVTQGFTGFIRELSGVVTPLDEMTDSMMAGARFAKFLQDNIVTLKAFVAALTIYLMRNFLLAIIRTSIQLGAAALKASVFGRSLIATRKGALAAAAGLKVFKSALASTGVGLALLAGGYLVEYILRTDEAEESTDSFKEALEKMVTAGEKVAMVYHLMTKEQQAHELSLQQSRVLGLRDKANALTEALAANAEALKRLTGDTQAYNDAVAAANQVDTGGLGVSNLQANFEATANLNQARMQLNETERAASLDRAEALTQLQQLNDQIAEQEQLHKDMEAVYRGEASSIEQLRKQREELAKAVDEVNEATKKATGFSLEEIETLSELIDKYDATGKTIRDLEADLATLEKAQGASTAGNAALGTTAERTAKAIANLKYQLALAKNALTPLEKAQREWNDALEDLRARNDEVQQAQIAYNRAIREADEALKAGSMSIEQYNEWVKLQGEVLDETKEKLASQCKTAKEVRECQTDSAKRIEEVWKEAMRNVQDAFADAFRGAFDSFSDFSERLLSAFKDMIANMLAAWFTSGLQNIFQGNPWGQGNANPFGGVFNFLQGQAAGSAAGGGGGGLGGWIAGLGTKLKSLWGNLTGFLGDMWSGFTDFFSGSNAAFGMKGGAGAGSTLGSAIGGGLVGFASGSIANNIFGNRGRNNGAWSTAGGVIGSIFGGLPGAIIGGAIGSFVSNLLGGAKKLESAVLDMTASMDAVTLTNTTVVSKQRSFFRGKKYTTNVENLDASSIENAIGELVAALSNIGSMLGVDVEKALEDWSYSVSIDIKDKTTEQIEQILETQFNKIIVSLIGEFVDSAEGLSDRLTATINMFKRNAEEFIRAFELAAAIDLTLLINPVVRAREEFQAEQMTIMEGYRGFLDAYRDILAEYDGSLEALESLAMATALVTNAQYELARAYLALDQQVSEMFQSSAQTIREALMSEEELYNYRRSRIDELVEMAQNTVDPAELARLADEINRLGLDAFNMLDESQQAILGPEFIEFFQGLEALFGDQIWDGLSQLEADASAIDQEVADTMIQAAQIQADAAITFDRAVMDLLDGVAAWKAGTLIPNLRAELSP